MRLSSPPLGFPFHHPLVDCILIQRRTKDQDKTLLSLALLEFKLEAWHRLWQRFRPIPCQ